MAKKDDFMNSGVASGLGMYAKVTSIFMTFFGVIIIAVLMYFGIKQIRGDKYVQTTGRIEKVEACPMTTTTGKHGNVTSVSYSCNVSVMYVVNGAKYTHNTHYQAKVPPNVGDTINVWYNSSNPNEVQTSWPISGWILLFIAFVIAVIVFVNLYFTFKSREYATISGGVNVVNDIF